MTASRTTRFCRCGARLSRDHTIKRCATCLASEHNGLVGAPELPPGSWREAVLEQALASRHMGRVIRAWRTHPHHGRRPYPQERVAEWSGITQTQLSRIENGAPIVHLDKLISWARILRIPADVLWFALPHTGETSKPDADNSMIDSATSNRAGEPTNSGAPLGGESEAAEVLVSPAWEPLVTVELIGRFTREDLSVDRRQATRAIAGVVFGGFFLDGLERWMSHPAQALVPKPRRRRGIGTHEVEQIEHAAHLFRSWGDQFGGGLRRKAVVGQLSEVADELRDFSHPEKIQRRLFAVMAQLAQTAASMSWDSGHAALAQRYYVLALRAAKEAGDSAFGANVLAGMARQFFYLGRVADGLELVRLAQDGVGGSATPRIKSMLHSREAWAYARLGRLAAFRRSTSRAEDLLRSSTPGDDPYWIAYFDESELAGVTGGRLLEAAHSRPELAGETVVHIERAVRLRRSQSLRSRALDQLGLAEAQLIRGEADEASRLGHVAADVVEKTHSDRVRVKLAELYVQTDRYRRVPSVIELRSRVKELLDAHAS